MKPIIKTTNPVTLNFAEAVLKDAGIECFVMDTHVSVLEGSIGAIPRRMMVIDDDHSAAVRALELAGLGKDIFRDR